MEFRQQPSLNVRLVNAGIRLVTHSLLKIDARALTRVPARGPLIMVTNHVNFLEAPVLYTELAPRPATAFAKIESWDNRWMARLFNLWQIIPVRRGEADLKAIKLGVQALKSGLILGISPEGTRSKNGVLQDGHPGTVMLAQMSQAPILPIACFGHEDYQQNMKKLRRTPFTIQAGRPFYLDDHGQRVSGAIRQQMTVEIMYQIAELLPERYRGKYSDLSQASTDYLRFAN
ncbi:MAG: 1-acyl-sn-glycerol-3-phosphate acyltransferase [Anaerolineales bacterium]|nr:1-acyl-sn-glycerol-3-phosphate acyltransferase [Anaerolineales bacterium]